MPVAPYLVLALILPGIWIWWWFSTLNPGVALGRGTALALGLGALLGAWNLWKKGSCPRPALWCLLALGWQALALAWAPVRDPGLIWLSERGAALVLAAGLAAPSLAGLALAGLAILMLACLTGAGSLGGILHLGLWAPFGNANFDVGAALPLLAVGIAAFLWRGGRWWLFALGAVAVVALLGGGRIDGDACRAAWLGGGIAVLAALILRLPARAHAWGFALLGGGLLLGLCLCLAGVIDAGGLGASGIYRVHLWRAALEASAGWHGLLGWGPGSSVAVLIEQPAYADAFRAVPSFAEHAHNEFLQILLDGGLVLAGLLGAALVASLRPLWRGRSDPAAAALLVGWCCAGALALVESHLSQPGGLLCLALLTAATWTRAEPQPLPRALPLAAGGFSLLALGIALRDAGDGGNPTMLTVRAQRRLEHLTEPEARLAELDRLRARVGPLDWIDLDRARELRRLGRLPEAAAALAAHRRRCPAAAAVPRSGPAPAP